jgi:carboxyl-terminal processing protease
VIVKALTVVLVILLATLSPCAAASEQPAGVTAAVQSPTEYVDRAMALLQRYHVNRKNVKWPDIESRARQAASSATTLADAHGIVDSIIADLGERHTFLVRARSTASAVPQAGASPRPEPLLPEIESRRIGAVGYVSIPTFAGGGGAAEKQALRIRKKLAEVQAPSVCGWIVDLRSNEGGNMHAALLGLGPLLGAGRLGSVVGGEMPQHWFYTDGEQMLISSNEQPGAPEQVTGQGPIVDGTRSILSLSEKAPKLAGVDAPLAVLIGPNTSSAREGIAVSFMGRPNVRTFGMPTAGRSSANIGLKLADGAQLIITYGAFADRTGQTHSPLVQPMTRVDFFEMDARVPDVRPLDAALQWIRGASQECGSATESAAAGAR